MLRTILQPIRYLFGINGRITATDFYWRVILSMMISGTALAIIAKNVENPDTPIHMWPIMFTVLVTATQIIRRYHDLGMSAWHAVFYLHGPLIIAAGLSKLTEISEPSLLSIPLVGLPAFGLIALFYAPADKSDNKYGPAKPSNMDALFKVPPN